MRIGIFGGTFDPVHYGHLIVAEQAREQANLDQVWFVPSARPPHKLEQPITPFDRRADMLQLAVAGQPNFQVVLLEKERPGPSFTVDTLVDLKRAYPADELCLIVGADCLPDFHTWREPARILELATLVAVARPGWDLWTPERLAHAIGLKAEHAVRLETVQIPLIGIASRDMRVRAREGRSLLYFTPRAVEVFIREKKIYI